MGKLNHTFTLLSSSYLIHLSIIIVIVSDTKNTLNIIPNGTSKFRGVHISNAAHCEIGQVVGAAKLLVQ